ncbi:efflux RND transporter permease subunit [Photobacterium lipolyticum]|uniref:RND transporter n=1 Tax=Photobacterium lipolyticum TaxID=266810 RepID=A0A2T3N2W4_9GAMM|nr:MMPL family transporter [Photobacterium lipolyticum]PSW06706.1 RND transporter [Photobacterium lipolyticum]
MTVWLRLLSSLKNIRRLTFISLFICFMAMSGLTKLTMVSDYRIFFDSDNPELMTYESIQQQYLSSDNVLLMLIPPEGQDALSEQGLALQLWLTDQAWLLPFVTRVDSLPNFPRTQVDGDDLYIEELLQQADQINPSLVAELKAFVTQEIQLTDQLVDRQGHFSALNLTVQLPGNNPKEETLQVAAGIKKLVAEAKLDWPEYRLYSTGTVMLNNAFFEAAKADFISLIPVMLLGIIIAASLLLRSWLAMLSLTTVMSLSIAAALGMSAHLGMALSAPTVSVPIILATISVASSVHLLAAIQRQQGEPLLRLQHALKKTLAPITLTNLTTIIGFLSMNFSDSPPFRDLGNMVALGVFFSWVLTLSVIPCLLLHLPMISNSAPQTVEVMMSWLGNAVSRHYRKILLFGLPVTIGLSLFAFSNVPNDDFVDYFDHSVPFRQQTDFINDNLTGIYSLEFSVETSEINGMLHPDRLKTIEQFSLWLREQPEVTAVVTITDVLKDIRQNMHQGDPDQYLLPDSQQETAQYILLYEMSLPFGKSLNDRINMDKSATRITARLMNLDSIGMKAFETRALAFWQSSNRDPSVSLQYSSPTLMFSHIGVKNTQSLIEGGLLALVLISLLLIAIFRSLFFGIFSAIPNLLPVMLAFGAWGLFSGEISMGLASVSSMVIGIVVDDTVHFLHHFRRYRQQCAIELAVKKTMVAIGPAMIISSLVLTLGFLMLSFSSFDKNAAMGLLTALTIVLAVVADLLLLPALLIWLDKMFLRRSPVSQHATGGSL